MKTDSRTTMIAGAIGVFALFASPGLSQDSGRTDARPELEALVTPNADEIEGSVALARPSRRIMPLQTLKNGRGDLNLDGFYDSQEFEFWVDRNVQLDKVQLNLGYLNSDKILADNSGIDVLINGQPITRLPVVEGKQPVRAQIKLPKTLIRQGVNTIALQATQQHVLGCSNDLRPELWTSLEPNTSYMILDEFRDSQELLLSALDEPGRWWPLAGRPVEVITARDRVDETLLRAGTLVSQGYALRSESPDLKFRHVVWDATQDSQSTSAALGDLSFNESNLYGIDVFLAIRPDLKGTPAEIIADQVTGPTIAIVGRDGKAPLLVLSGRDSADLLIAAAAFANPDIDLPEDAAIASITRVPATKAEETFTLTSDGTYSFADLEFVQGNAINPTATLDFDLPSEFYAADNRRATIALSYAYAPDLPRNSNIQVLVNNDIANIIRLERAGGDVVTERRLPIELARLRPGRCTISFVPYLAGGKDGACLPPSSQRPRIEFFDDSTISMPELLLVSHQPDLNLFRSTALPYSKNNGADASLAVTSSDSETIGASWTLAGRLARSAGYPLIDLDTSLGGANDRGHTIIIGPYDDLQAALNQPHEIDPVLLASVELQGPQVFDVAETEVPAGPVRQALAAEIELDSQSHSQSSSSVVAAERRNAWRDELAPNDDGWPDMFRDYDVLKETVNDGFVSVAGFFRATPLSAGRMAFRDDNFDALIFASESKQGPGTTTTIITARDEAELAQAVENLVRPEIWDNLEGTAAAWDVNGSSVATATLVPVFRTSDVPEELAEKKLYYANLLAANPVIWVFLALGVVGIMTVISWVALRVRRH